MATSNAVVSGSSSTSQPANTPNSGVRNVNDASLGAADIEEFIRNVILDIAVLEGVPDSEPVGILSQTELERIRRGATSTIFLPQIVLLPKTQRGMWCQACKNVWTTDIDELPVKEQSVVSGSKCVRVLEVNCPRCHFAATVTEQDEIVPLRFDEPNRVTERVTQ